MHVDQGHYRVSDLVGWKRDGTLDLRPHFQRGSVWKERDKSFLIDSLLRGFPIPMIVLQLEERDGPTDLIIRRVVDGQQRLRTIIAFIERGLLNDLSPNDKWPYRPSGLVGQKGSFSFENLPPTAQSKILSTRLSVATIEAGATESQVLEVYDRLNSTGAALSAQELRYARRPGAFADLCYTLARQNQTRWTGWRLFNDSDIARMKEVEYTAELLLLLRDGVTKTGRKEIDNAYSNFAQSVPDQDALAVRFSRIMDDLDAILAFPTSPDPIRILRSRGWFYALFAWIDQNTKGTSDLIRTLPLVARQIDHDRKSNPDLVRAISGSASDKKSRESRLNYLIKAVEAVS